MKKTAKYWQRKINDFSEVVLKEGKYRVCIEFIGEGWSGDYEDEDPQDEPLLRFSCEKYMNWNQWEEINDSSYCTRLTIDVPKLILVKVARQIMDILKDENPNQKRMLEQMSWVGLDDFQKKKPKSK